MLRGNDELPSTRAAIYKQTLSLLLAQRRPSYYLLAGRDELALLADRYLRLMMKAGLIDEQLGTAALQAQLIFSPSPTAPADARSADAKAANAVRRQLLSLLDLPSHYQLDRLDLSVETALDLPTQQQVSEALARLADPSTREAFGLYGERLLKTGSSTEELVYSVRCTSADPA
jgi:membrane peptidoglycan carboxypeptidase